MAADSVCIGRDAGSSGFTNGGIVLNGSGSSFPSSNPAAQGLFVKPIRGFAHGVGVPGMLIYDATSGEITYSTN